MPKLVALPSWRSLLRTRGRANEPIPDLHNVLIVLRNEPGFSVAFAFHEMQKEIVIRASPPLCHGADAGNHFPRFATEEDVTRLQEWMQMIMPRLGREHVHNALDEFARSNPIHPLKDWLNLIEVGDREPVLWNWMHHALGTPPDDYHRAIGQMFLVAMVARVFEPACQADYMLVLEGPQGELKSQFCRLLAGDEYFSDNLPHLDTDPVRVSMHLRGKWLIEISELSAFSRAESAALKAFITRREEIYTPKYGRKERREPRESLFIGTTNDDDYIKDDTGGRRLWPVKVERVNLDWLALNREPLFAEAVAAYRGNAAWWPDRAFEKRFIAPMQETRHATDAWRDAILPKLDTRSTTTIAELASELNVPIERLDMFAQKRIASVLRKAEWSKSKDTNGRVVWRKSNSSQRFCSNCGAMEGAGCVCNSEFR